MRGLKNERLTLLLVAEQKVMLRHQFCSLIWRVIEATFPSFAVELERSGCEIILTDLRSITPSRGSLGDPGILSPPLEMSSRSTPITQII